MALGDRVTSRIACYRKAALTSAAGAAHAPVLKARTRPTADPTAAGAARAPTVAGVHTHLDDGFYDNGGSSRRRRLVAVVELEIGELR